MHGALNDAPTVFVTITTAAVTIIIIIIIIIIIHTAN
jgi:hypothetical protein